MSELHKIQRAFQESLQKQNDSVAEYLAKPNNMSEADRLKVYYKDYFFRLRDSLKEDFEKTCYLIGAEKFEALVATYLDVYPSKTYTLRDVGFQFPAFLTEQQQEPGLIEMAQFECGMIHALYAIDGELLTMEGLASIDPEQWLNLQFQLHASLQKCNMSYNTLDVWAALDNDEQCHSEQLPSPAICLIWRYQNNAYFRLLSVEEAALLDSIQSEQSFAELCEKMLDYFDEEEAVTWVAGILQAWVADGLFAGYCVPA